VQAGLGLTGQSVLDIHYPPPQEKIILFVDELCRSRAYERGYNPAMAGSAINRRGAMASPSDFEHLDIVVRSKNGHYLASMPQINVVAASDSLSAALEKLEKKKQDLVAELTAADCLQDFRVAPSDPYLYSGREQAISVRRSALGFIGKTIVVVAALVIGGFFFTRYATKTVDQMLSHQSAEMRDRFSSVGGAKFWTNLEKQLANAADPKNDLPAAKKEVILAQIRTIAERYRPFVHEVSLLFYDPPESNPPKSQ
jgi:hypothetical protein